MKLVYFAWVRERIGKAEEKSICRPACGPPATWFPGCGPRRGLRPRVRKPRAIRVAMDQVHVPRRGAGGRARDRNLPADDRRLMWAWPPISPSAFSKPISTSAARSQVSQPMSKSAC